MVKLNKKELTAKLLNDDLTLHNEIDWKQFLVDYQNQSPAEAVGNIMNKLMSKEGLEFDQICLILKHYLMLNSEKDDSHLSVFLHSTYVNLLVDRFNQSRGVNEQWMIAEIFKLVSSVCTPNQASLLIQSSSFQAYLLASAFNVNILQQLKSTASGIKLSEQAILVNIFDTISNICEIKSELVNAVSTSQIEWVASALCESDHTNKDFILSLARFLNVMTEHLVKSETSSNLESILLDFYLNRNFFVNCYNHLATFQPQNDEQGLVYLNAKLLLIESFVNLIVSSSKFESELKLNKSVYLLNILREYSILMSQALNFDLEETKKPAENDESSSENEKSYFRTFEKAIESKLVSIDLISSICEYFSPDGRGDEEELESVDSGDEMTENKGQMDIEMGQQSNPTHHADSQHIQELTSLLHQSGALNSLLRTICKDNEQSFQETEKIAHICNSIKLIRAEAVKTYLLIVDSFYSNRPTTTVKLDLEHLFSLINFLIAKPIEEFINDEESEREHMLVKLVDLIHSLFLYFNETSALAEFDLTKQASLVDLVKQVLFKFKTDSIELCIKFARMIGLVAIKLRNENLTLGMPLITQCAGFLIEMTSASFQYPDQQKLETLRLNAELMDLLIDLFSEDNMIELEASLGFVDKIKVISDMFYSKFKQLGKKQKMAKEKSAVLRTVKDNFKDFVDYKIKHSRR